MQEDDEELFLKKIETKLLSEMKLRGIKGITKVFMRKEKKPGQIDANGKYRSASCTFTPHITSHNNINAAMSR